MHGPLLWLLLLSGCATSTLQPAPDKLQPWTTTLRDQQPEDAFAAVYKVGSKQLIFIAAQHANRDDSLTFRLIRDAYAVFQIDTVIAEGFPTSRGANPASVFEYAAKSSARPDGFVEGGETVPTVVGARQENATLWGGEPDDLSIKARILAQDFSVEDLLGFYVLRNIPQWIGERRIENAGDPRLQSLVVAALSRNRQHSNCPRPFFRDSRNGPPGIKHSIECRLARVSRPRKLAPSPMAGSARTALPMRFHERATPISTNSSSPI